MELMVVTSCMATETSCGVYVRCIRLSVCIMLLDRHLDCLGFEISLDRSSASRRMSRLCSYAVLVLTSFSSLTSVLRQLDEL